MFFASATNAPALSDNTDTGMIEPTSTTSTTTMPLANLQRASSSTAQVDSDVISTRQQPAVVPLSPWSHVAIFATILTPIALLPYMAVRRHLVSLNRAVAELGQSNAAVHRELRATLLELSIRRDEHDGLRSAIQGWKQELDRMRTKDGQNEVIRARLEGRMQDEINKLKTNTVNTRVALSSLQELSSSLADIAAFMHEVEMQQPLPPRKDGRGIERMRQLAYKLQQLPNDETEPSARP